METKPTRKAGRRRAWCDSCNSLAELQRLRVWCPGCSKRLYLQLCKCPPRIVHAERRG
jgi:hypothetical protein